VSDQVRDLRSSLAVIRRRSWWLAAAAAVGLGAGIGYVALVPPELTSTSLILLPSPPEGSAGQTDITTQVRVARSTDVLGAAGQAVHPQLSVRAVENRVAVSSETDELLAIRASDHEGAQAQALAQAVATSYVSYVQRAARAVVNAAQADLQVRQKDLQQRLADLQTEIDATSKRLKDDAPNSADAKTDARLMAQLRTEQADLSLRLDKVKGELDTSLPADSAAAGVSIVQNATQPIGPSMLRRMAVLGPAGAVFAALVALIVIVIRLRRDPRLALRDEIADAVGSPVLAAVRSRPQGSVAGWSTLLKTYEAPPVDSWAFRQVLRTLATADTRGTERRVEARSGSRVDHPSTLAVVCLAGDTQGLALAPQLAGFAASLGVVTVLVTALGDDKAAPLWAACAAAPGSQPRPDLYVGPWMYEGADLTIVLAVVDRERPWLGNIPETARTVLAVAASTATEQELARVAVAVDDAGRRIDGILVADPDRTDRTTGRHTLDERATHVSLPVRLTGLGPVDPAGEAKPRTRR